MYLYLLVTLWSKVIPVPFKPPGCSSVTFTPVLSSWIKTHLSFVCVIHLLKKKIFFIPYACVSLNSVFRALEKVIQCCCIFLLPLSQIYVFKTYPWCLKLYFTYFHYLVILFLWIDHSLVCRLLMVISLTFAIIENDVMGCLCSQCPGTRNMGLLGYTKGAF